MAKPYQEGNTWSFRLRIQGQDIYQGNFASAAQANKAMLALKAEISIEDKAAGRGPFNTTVAEAFSLYAAQRLPFLKGAPADSVRINRYLRAMDMPIIQLERIANPADAASRFWNVHFRTETARTVPNSLKEHRAAQAEQSRTSDQIRQQIASTPMADVTATLIQRFVDALVTHGYGSATIELERSELRRVFSHARKKWHWTRPIHNPASQLTIPAVKGSRSKVLTNEEWAAMAQALCDGGNEYAPYLFALMLETAMRSCEPLTYTRWKDVNWDQRILVLPDAKSGGREVPLGPGAIAILEKLFELATEKANKKKQALTGDDALFPTTYEAVKKAWSVARAACGLSDIRMHDLRHTSTTRYALQLNGDIFRIMGITGHKTTKMVRRYTHIKATHIAHELHGEEIPIDMAPAGYKRPAAQKVIDALSSEEAPQATALWKSFPEYRHANVSTNVIAVDFKKQAA